MRGRKLQLGAKNVKCILFPIKKESPNEGTETNSDGFNEIGQDFIKKESPNEGTET